MISAKSIFEQLSHSGPLQEYHFYLQELRIDFFGSSGRIINQSEIIVRIDEQIRQSVLVTRQKWKWKDPDFRIDLCEAEYYGNASLLKEV